MKLKKIRLIQSKFEKRSFEDGEYIASKQDGSKILLTGKDGGLYTEQGLQFLNIFAVKSLNKIIDEKSDDEHEAAEKQE